MRIPFLFLIATLCCACSKEPVETQSITLTLPPGDGPWQIWTYDEQPVHWETVEYLGKKLYKRAYSVYVDVNGRFIFNDSKPIKTFKGESLYWASNGEIITDHRRVIPREQVFSLNGKPISPEQPLLLKEQIISARAEIRPRNG